MKVASGGRQTGLRDSQGREGRGERKGLQKKKKKTHFELTRRLVYVRVHRHGGEEQQQQQQQQRRRSLPPAQRAPHDQQLLLRSRGRRRPRRRRRWPRGRRGRGGQRLHLILILRLQEKGVARPHSPHHTHTKKKTFLLLLC